jgi:RNA-binding protein YhbY
MEVLLNTSGIQNASQQLRSKAVELESAIRIAEGEISPLRSFVSPRIERDLSSWDEIKVTLLKNLQNLIDSADELARAAADNEAANN